MNPDSERIKVLKNHNENENFYKKGLDTRTNDNISQATINNDNSTRVCKVKNEPITPYDAYMCAKKLEKYFITRIPEKLTRVWDIIGDIQEEANSRSINEQNKDEEIDIKLFNLNNCK
ncbi:hypothetical protein A3Q56_03882 [Intoshia linei]|uniref:Uncharacterized protein n=1 Tax=Intoshia linei TaxID=1819745 RepID=A0A177B2A2_9BILA|nr:hypothetical protein A3Q56_03882 [Intoshia linei]